MTVAVKRKEAKELGGSGLTAVQVTPEPAPVIEQLQPGALVTGPLNVIAPWLTQSVSCTPGGHAPVPISVTPILTV